MLEFAEAREELQQIYSKKSEGIEFQTEEEAVVRKLPMKADDGFEYVIWGVCMPNSYHLYEAMKNHYKNAKMLFAIDSFVTGTYKDAIEIFSPKKAEEKLTPNVKILVVAPAAHEAAKRWFKGRYELFLITGSKMEYLNYDECR